VIRPQLENPCYLYTITLESELAFDDFVSEADPLDYHLLARLPDEAVLTLDGLYRMSSNQRAADVPLTKLNNRGLESVA
jgi:hypothetical protein